MGALSDFDLAALIAAYGGRYLVETGAGKGDGVEEALRHDFLQVYAIESAHKLALDVALRHSENHKLTVIHARSEKGLREALEEMEPGLPAIFWLKDPQELRVLASLRDLSRDVFLIGFENGEAGLGEVLAKTHKIDASLAYPLKSSA